MFAASQFIIAVVTLAFVVLSHKWLEIDTYRQDKPIPEVSDAEDELLPRKRIRQSRELTYRLPTPSLTPDVIMDDDDEEIRVPSKKRRKIAMVGNN